MSQSKYTVGILVVSDSCSSKQAEDKSGVNLKDLLNNYEYNSKKIFTADVYSIVGDNVEEIKQKLIEWSDDLKLNLILTTGGTGISPRDLTPDATKQVIDTEVKGITDTILIESLKITKFAMLSRAIAGIRKKSLIINLPGSKKASEESLCIVFPVLKHAVDLINDIKPEIVEEHKRIQKNFGREHSRSHSSDSGGRHRGHHNNNKRHSHGHEMRNHSEHHHSDHHSHNHHHNHEHDNHHGHHHERKPHKSHEKPHHKKPNHHNHSHSHHYESNSHESPYSHDEHKFSHKSKVSSQTTSLVTESDINGKPRKSTYPMISVDEALSLILKNSQHLETEEVYYMDALNRISAMDIIANDPLPPFAASIKDGFAVKLTEKQKEFIQKKLEPSDEKVSFVFEVIGSSHAGDDAIHMDLKEGQCVKINTGAPVPLLADAVIQIEDTISIEKNEKGQDTKIEIVATSTCGSDSSSNRVDIKIGQDIRPIGFDIKQGEVVVKERAIIRAPQIGICATVGALKIKVFKIPSVGLISTGNELRKPDEAVLSSGQIRDSNKSLLYSALKSFGIEKIFDAGIATDEPDSTLNVFKNAIENSDIIISTGGVSMGDKDLVKDVLLKDFEATIHFARLNMKPGKPTTFASCVYNGKTKLFFCLPGNPVSSIVTFNLVVVPCLKKLMGYVNPFHTQIKVKCEFNADLDPRPEYHRCFVDFDKSYSNEHPKFPKAYSTGNQHSSRLLSMNEANCLVILPGRTNSKTLVNKGEIHDALIIERI